MKVAATLFTQDLAAPLQGDRTVDLPDGVAAAVDEVDTKAAGGVRWIIIFSHSSGKRSIYEILAVHDGTAAADATSGDYDIVGGAQTAADADDVGMDVMLNGAGAAQRLQLVAQAPSAGWKASIHRMPLVGDVS